MRRLACATLLSISATTAFAQDPVTAVPGTRTVFENDQVRITKLVCASGKSCLEVAGAAEPILFVVLNTSRFTLGGTREITMRAGDTHWIPAGTSVQGNNVGESAAEVLRIDIKPAR